MTQNNHRLILGALVCAMAMPEVIGAQPQDAPQPVHSGQKLALQAALVLTPEFCATKTKKGTWGINQEKFEVGKLICADLEPALKSVFSAVTRVEDASAVGSAQVVLTPRILDIVATQAKIAFSNRTLTISVEWTAKDSAGKTVWVETIEGSAKHHMGNSFTYKKNLDLVVKDSSQDVADQSASRMTASQQLRELANRSAASGEKN
jgi:hypothetical protein